MYICPKRLANYLLCSSNLKLPINQNHYIIGKELSVFSKLVCVEKELSKITCNLKDYYSCCKYPFFR